MKELNNQFKTSVLSEKNAYGTVEKELSNGFRELRSNNELGYPKREIFNSEGKLTHVVEKIADDTRQLTKYDDNGNAYLRETTVRGDNPKHTIELTPETTIKHGNFSATTDSFGRPIINKVENVQISGDKRQSLSSKLRDASYLEDDHRGHLIADHLGGPASKENIVPQTEEVNLSKFKTIEKKVEQLVKEGKKVDYEVKSNYDGKDQRPSSFEVKIVADGAEVPLDKELSKIYNGNPSRAEKAIINAKEGVYKIKTETAPMRDAGREQGIEAAKITFAISTVDNVILLYDGEITVDEMVTNIAKDTGKAGLYGYGAGFISETVAVGLNATGSEMLQSIAGSNAPAAFVSFAITSHGSIIEFAQGNIDGAELAYDLGNNAVGVTGSIVGAEYGAVVGTAIMPGAGTVVGGVVGGMIGYSVSTGAYKTALEYGSKGADVFATKAKEIGKATIEYAEENVPEKAADIKNAINQFATNNNLPFNFG